MKANEISEKIYVTNYSSEVRYNWHDERLAVNDIEYTRTDAFIENAAIWFNNNFMVHDEYGVVSDSFDTKEEMYEDFINYMKGE